MAAPGRCAPFGRRYAHGEHPMHELRQCTRCGWGISSDAEMAGSVAVVSLLKRKQIQHCSYRLVSCWFTGDWLVS